MSPLIHGGDIQHATHMYGRPAEDWLDLSTGINVHSYPLPNIPVQAWQQLPYPLEACVHSAWNYYQSRQVLLTAGSQPIMENLPALLTQLGNNKGILIPDIGYQEHRAAWQQICPVVNYDGLRDDQAAITAKLTDQDIGHLLIINPNNPTGVCYSVEHIYAWAEQLGSKRGYVVVDEAFIDCYPEQSCVTDHMPANLVVLRSFGKFFGLAGIRLGAFIAVPHLLEHMANQLGIWRVNGPAQYVAAAAFADLNWQQQMRTKLLAEQSLQMAIWETPLTTLGACIQGDTPLFRSFKMPVDLAQHLHQQAAMHGILTRPVDINDNFALLRLGNIDITNQSHQQRCQMWLHSIG